MNHDITKWIADIKKTSADIPKSTYQLMVHDMQMYRDSSNFIGE